MNSWKKRLKESYQKYESIRCGAHPAGVGNKRSNEKPCGTLPNSGGHRWMHAEHKMSGDVDASSHMLLILHNITPDKRPV